jgi:uncharacterized protein YdhG (YjbR/CyaY superfamily)
MSPIESYIQTFPPPVQERLNQLRAVILKEAPLAIESISYGMPAYKTNGIPLVYFAGYKQHIGLYVTPSGHSAFAEELKQYKKRKRLGAVSAEASHFQLTSLQELLRFGWKKISQRRNSRRDFEDYFFGSFFFKNVP